MPTTVKFRRGTTSQNDSFTGAAGELSIDETLDTIRVHDGSTAGGYEITQNAATQTLTNKTLTSPTIDGASIGGHLIPDANETYDLGSSSYKFRDLYLSGTSLNLGSATITASGSSVVLPSGTTIDGGSGAAVDLNSAQTLTNKTLTSPVISSISNTGTLTLPTSTGTVALTSDITLSTLSVTATASELNTLDGITSTTAELNLLDGVTATTTELNYVDGVTSAIQTQLDAKQATITGGATTIASSNLTATRAVVSDGSGKIAVSSVTSTELGYLDGVTSNVQTQINALPTSLSDLSVTATASELNILDGVTATTAELNILDGVTATAAELNYVDGVTSNVQTQLDAKVAKTSTTGSAILPVGTTAQRDGTPSAGYLRWNTTESSAEVYDGSDWGSVGGGGAAETPYAEHANSISANYAIASGNNAVSGGPITVSSGYSVTVPSGSSWTIV